MWTNYWSRTIETTDISGAGASFPYQYEPSHQPPMQDPFGVAVDTARGEMYWPALGSSSISKGSIDGTQPAVFAKQNYAGQPRGLAIDPASQYLYWTNLNSGYITRMRTDGTGFETIYMRSPGALAPVVDPPAGRIYWIDSIYGTPTIAYGSLDGSGPVSEISLAGCPGTIDLPFLGGLAVDPARGVAYLATSKEVARISLDGTNCTYLAPTQGDPNADVWGLALDPDAGRLYWAKGNPTNTISSLQLDPLGVPTTVWTGAAGTFPVTPIIIARPSGTVALASGGSQAPSTLTCTATWAGDQLAGSRYRVPRGATTYAWSRDGSTIPGADAATIPADAAGSYQCMATASNYAGATTVRSPTVAITRPGPTPAPAQATLSVRRTRLAPVARGTWRFVSSVVVSGPGVIRVVGRTASAGSPVCRGAATSRGTGTLRVYCVVRTAVRATRPCRAVPVRLAFTFTAAAGASASATRLTGLPAARNCVTG